MVENITHWYDGRFYDLLIAPNQDRAFEKIKEFIPKGSSLLDAGCGTGRLCFGLQGICKRIDGVDASEKNILTAKNNLKRQPHDNITFYNSDIKSFLEKKEIKDKYDFAVLSYVIHEISERKRANILNLLSSYADKIIIIDYLVPHPKSIAGMINRVVEFLAGKNHNRNFKTFLKNNGIYGLSEETGLKIIREIKNEPKTAHIVVFSKSENYY
ncbi:MAG: class I SAM-dependent methyltransferase [Ignavibacteriae bacterium]|nr:class I SAM-dependent methyltransferase [Ignavibacteriota bacterium]